MAKKNLVVSFDEERIPQSTALELAKMLQKFYSTPGRLEAMEKWRAERREGIANGKEQMLLVQ